MPTILPDNTAKVNLVRPSQGAKTAGRCDGSRQGEVRLVDGNGRTKSSNFTVDVDVAVTNPFPKMESPGESQYRDCRRPGEVAAMGSEEHGR